MSCSSKTTSSPQTVANDDSKKQSILSAREYKELCDFIECYKGLAIDCEMELLANFSQYNRLTLKAILKTVLNYRMRAQHFRYDDNAKKYLAMYKQCSKASPQDSTILLNIARAERMGPAMMCRSILKLLYQTQNKTTTTKLMRYPHLIEDPQLSANVAQCLISDTQDGPLIDLKRRALGEEYEFKLKQMATAAGMHFYDENVLRRLGYDKTPDIKMIIPFLYKGETIHWIESKADFGDIKTHKYNIQQQLSSYSNRFGTGIIIYWFGYHIDILNSAENFIVLDNFPDKVDIELLDLSETNDFGVKKEDDIEKNL